MKCEKYREQISLMLDGELDASSSAALTAHMESCPDCRKFHGQLKALDDTLRRVSSHVPAAALAARVKEQLSRRKTRRLEAEFVAWGRVPAMVMIVLLALGLGNLMGRSISQLLTTNGGAGASLELISPDSEDSFSDVLLDLGTEENQQ